MQTQLQDLVNYDCILGYAKWKYVGHSDTKNTENTSGDFMQNRYLPSDIPLLIHPKPLTKLDLALASCVQKLQCKLPNNHGIKYMLLIVKPLASLSHLEKNLPIMPLATFVAIPPELNAPPAKFEACPNLSHLENASVFVTVRLSAITTSVNQINSKVKIARIANPTQSIGCE